MKTIYVLPSIIAIFLLAGLLRPEGISQDEQPHEQVIPKGNPALGRVVFEAKNCHRCHTVEGEKFPEKDLPAIANISLGGENNQQWGRDEYAHHIMDPTHLISPDHQKAMLIVGDKLGAENSPMPNLCDQLTVTDLINVATYLEDVTKK